MDVTVLRAKLGAIIAETIPDTGLFTESVSTGGNCTADSIWIGDRRVEITDGWSRAAYADDDCRDLVFSYFTRDGDGAGEGQLTIEWGDGDEAAYWSNVRTSLQAWVAGNPYDDKF